MTPDQLREFGKTTIGADHISTGASYPIDVLLDYLSGLIKMSAECTNMDHKIEFESELDAVRQVLRNQTKGNFRL